MSTLENLIEKLPPDLQDVARRYAGMLGANVNEDDLLAIVAYGLKWNYEGAYDVLVQHLTNDELAEIHSDANTRLRELQAQTGSAPGMPQLIVEDLLGILIRFGILALIA